MSTSISFAGSLSFTAGGACGCSTNGETVAIGFEGGAQSFDVVLTTATPYIFTASSFVPMPLSDEMVTVSFISMATTQGTSVQLLVGAPPVWNGTAGVFPTGFVGGETFTFALQTYVPATGGWSTDATIAVVFTVAAQTAQDVARAINSALALLGYPPLATVLTSGQLSLTRAEPGQTKRLAAVVPNTVIGYPATSLGATGTGSPVMVSGVYIAQFPAISADNFWLQGSAYLSLLLAGT
jgi:hypothetical protein